MGDCTHYFTLCMVFEKVLIANIDKEGATPSSLKGKDLIDLEIPHTPNINKDSLLKIKPTILEKQTWEERAWKLDEVNKASSSKASYPVNKIDNYGIIKDKPSYI